MNKENFSKLPPELQERISAIVNQAAAEQAPAPAAQAPGLLATAQPQQTPAPTQPSLMDHIVALRHEVNHLNGQVAAIGQVTEAVGNAVGELYQMFQQQTRPTSFSTGFQAQPQVEDDEY